MTAAKMFFKTGICFGVAAMIILLSSRAGETLSQRDVYLGTSQDAARKIPIGVVTLGGGALKDRVDEILRSDLRRSLYFEIRPQDKWTPTEGGDLQQTGGDGSGLEALVVAEVLPRGNGYVLDGQIYEMEHGERIFGRRYAGDDALFRRMVHRFADEVTFRLAGEKGMAQTRIAYVSDVSGAKEIYVMDYDGFNPRKVTGNRTLNLSPAWSPDGKKLAYTSYREGNPDIHVVDLTTSRRWRVTTDPGLDTSPSWAPNGGLAYSASHGEGMNLYWVGEDGKGMKRLTYGLGASISPTWSPNGSDLAFTSDRGGSPQIYLMQADGTNNRRLTFDGDYNSDPQWSPRGDRIAFSCRRGGDFRICTISPDGKGLREITRGPGSDESPSWAPDGRHLVFSSSREGKRRLFMVDAEGGNPERLTQDAGNHLSPAWSPG
jgi:TolB protein